MGTGYLTSVLSDSTCVLTCSAPQCLVSCQLDSDASNSERDWVALNCVNHPLEGLTLNSSLGVAPDCDVVAAEGLLDKFGTNRSCSMLHGLYPRLQQPIQLACFSCHTQMAKVHTFDVLLPPVILACVLQLCCCVYKAVARRQAVIGAADDALKLGYPAHWKFQIPKSSVKCVQPHVHTKSPSILGADTSNIMVKRCVAVLVWRRMS